jgi:hypothetical protein
MGIARRQFLQAGLTSLVGWQFLNGDRVALAAEQYLQQATSSTQRKKALLIGINQYEAKEDSSSTSSQNGAANGWLPLHGCVNDVELQKELLIYRFGFAPQDIVTLTDRDATRHNITEAITEHLTAQTLPDDLVLVHFSGHGSRLGNYNTLVPVDSGLPQIQDITELEWRRALQAIATDKILCVIDAGFYYPNVSTIGNFRLRSRIGRSDWQLPPELALIEKQAIATNTVANSGTNPIGVFLQAASGDMLCADAQWSGFSSGAFTYSLVQQMWQITPATTIHWVMSNLVTNLDRRILHNENLSIDKQIMEMMETNGVKSKEISTNTFASLLPIPDFGADGVVTNISNDRLNNDRRSADVCLAGLPIDILTNYMAGSILNVNSNANSNVTVQLKSRNGFNGKVEVLSDRNSNPKLESGQLLQESIRAISRNLKLAIALDVGLSKIERVDATSAFSTLPNMFGVNANEQCADCLFGVQSASYGLFTVGHQPILGSFGSVGESVGVAIKRLQCFLESLLAAKLIRITENQAASHLNVRATIKAIVGIDERSVTIASKSAARAVRIPVNDTINNTVRTKPINIGDRLECQIENFSDQPLYTRIFCLDPRGKVLTPNFIATPYSNDGVIAPSETLTIPYPKAMMNWGVSAPQGNVDVQVVISRSPLWEIAKVLELSQRQTSSINGLIAIPNPLQVAQALLVDLDRAGKSSKSSDLNSFSNASDTWMLDVQQWATFNFSYQVV